MALTDGVHNGELYVLRLDEGTVEVVTCLTSLSWSVARDTTEVPACRGVASATGNWKSYIPGDKSMEISIEGQIQMAQDWDPHRFFGLANSIIPIPFVIEPTDLAPTFTPVVGGQRVTGSCWLTALEVSYPNNEVAVYSATLVVNGEPTSTIIV